MRRQRSVWLSSIKPQNIVYDAEHDEYRDVRWSEQPDQLAQERKDRRIEQDEVQRRMTATVLQEMDGGDLDGSDDDSFYSIDEGFENEDEEGSEMMFFDAASAISPRSSRAGSRPNSAVAGVFAQSDTMTVDFQSCKGSISESVARSDRMSAADIDDNIHQSADSMSLPIPVPVPMPIPPQTQKKARKMNPTSSSPKAKKTHYVTEKEATEAKTKGRLGFRVPTNLMILERARLLVICSREAYLPFEDEFDKESHKIDLEAATPNDKRTTPRSPKRNPLADSFIPLDLNPKLADKARIAGFRYGIEGRPAPKGSAFGAGCRAVACISEPKGLNVHDTRALLLRHEPSGALILSFRGTASMKHVKTDLMTHKVRVSLDTFLAIPSKREQARRLVQSIVPDAVENNLLAGSKEKVVLFDLLHVDGEELPDYLQSATKSNEEVPGLAVGRLHFGFYSSYCRVRRVIHQRVRQELTTRPGPLYITGHSLGGCLATVCAYDAARWILPTVESDLEKLGRLSEADSLTLSMYSYGAPRPGDRVFALAYDRLVKDTQRIVCDGDVITSGMPTWMNYAHPGMEDIFDYTGSIRVNPSVVEKATLKRRNSPERHYITNYAKVIKLARQPAISVLELLNLLRDAYGIERIVEDKKQRKKAAKRKRKKVEPPEQASPTRQDVPSSPPPPLLEPRSNAFDILYG